MRFCKEGYLSVAGREVMTVLHYMVLALSAHWATRLLQEAGLAVIFKFMMLNEGCTILT